MSEKEKTRYNDSELQEFRDLINSKIEAARHELASLQDYLSNANANGTECPGKISSAHGSFAGLWCIGGDSDYLDFSPRHLCCGDKLPRFFKGVIYRLVDFTPSDLSADNCTE